MWDLLCAKGHWVEFFFFPTIAGLSSQYNFRGPGQLCPCSDSLRDGRFGDRVPVWGRGFPHPSRLALGSSQPSIRWIPAVFPGCTATERGIDYPSPSSAEVKEREELYFYSLSRIFRTSIMTDISQWYIEL